MIYVEDWRAWYSQSRKAVLCYVGCKTVAALVGFALGSAAALPMIKTVTLQMLTQHTCPVAGSELGLIQLGIECVNISFFATSRYFQSLSYSDSPQNSIMPQPHPFRRLSCSHPHLWLQSRRGISLGRSSRTMGCSNPASKDSNWDDRTAKHLVSQQITKRHGRK